MANSNKIKLCAQRNLGATMSSVPLLLELAVRLLFATGIGVVWSRVAAQ